MRVAITGSIGSGKSEMGKILKKLGYTVIDTDELAGQLLEKGQDVYGIVIEFFGDKITDEQGNIRRDLLADRIFAHPDEKEELENMIHPRIWEEVERIHQQHVSEKVVFTEVPLLFETNSQSRFDKSVVVIAEKNTAIERLMNERNFKHEQAERRWNTQMDIQEKMSLADDVIFNNSDINDFVIEINRYLIKLLK